MGEGFKMRRGGGTPLNFKIVGGNTQPTNPKENMIWVNTDAPISEWVFSPDAPVSPVEGMVWIKTDRSSSTPFNALKKNNLSVYPTACKQYVNGAWAEKVAKVYQDGSWKSWNLPLFKDGETAAEAGSWLGDASLVDSEDYRAYGMAPNITVNSTISCTLPGGAGVTGAMRSEKAIDVSSYNTLRVVISENASHADIENFVALVPSGATLWDEAVVKISVDGNATGTFNVDISHVTGNYHIAYLMESYGFQSNVTIAEIILI